MMNALLSSRRLALLSALTLLLAACGSDPPVDTNQEENQQENQNQVENQNQQENQNQVDPDPFDPAVVPAHLIVDVSPTRFAYAQDTRVTPRARAYNYQWQPLGEVPVEWTVTPADLVEMDSPHNRWFLREKGLVTFEACAVDSLPNHPACASHTVVVGEGPLITLESPLGGEHYHGEDVIMVEGVVSAAVPVHRVQINGVDVSLDADNRFSYELTPKFGVNTVFVRAFDSLHPMDGVAAASFVWAPDYLPTTYDEGVLGTELDTAIIFKLGQNFFDNGSPPTTVSESQIITEDLADIIYLVLRFLDLNEQLPDPVVDAGGFYLTVPDVQIGEPRVEVDVTETGLQLFAQLQSITAQTSGQLDFADQLLDLTGSITAGLALFAEVDVVKASADDPVEVELVRFELAIETASADFASPEANAIFDLAESILRDTLEELLIDTVNLSFIDTLPDLLSDIFTSLETAIAYQPFDLDLGLGDPLLLEFYGQIGQLLPVRNQGIEGFVQAQLATATTQNYPGNPGVPSLTAGTRELPLFNQSRIQIGLDLLLINALFNNLWDAGLLDIDISDMVPAGLASLLQSGYASGKLPPVAAPPVADEPFDLILHLGQMELDLGWANQEDRFGARISVGVDLALDEGAIAIEISDEPVIDLWLIETTADAPFLDANGLRSLIRNQLWPEIEEAIGDGLSFGLPIPEIGGLEDVAPELADLDLDIRMTRPVSIRNGFLMLEAGFEGELFLD